MKQFYIRKTDLFRKKWLYVLVASAVVISIAVVIFLNLTRGTELPEMDAWARVGHYQSTLQVDSMQQALDDYLWTYSTGRYANDARMLRDRLNRERHEWEELLMNELLSVRQVEDYLDAHLDGFYRPQALLLLDSVAYLAALDEDCEEALLRYMEQYPSSRFTDKARQALKHVGEDITSAAERDSVTQVVVRHFNAMQHNSTAIVATLSENLSSYIGKPSPTVEDVLAYMKHFHRGSTEKQLRTADFIVKKMNTTVDEQPLYSVTFLLEETLNPDDSLKTEVKLLEGTAIVDNEWKISSLVLEKKQ